MTELTVKDRFYEPFTDIRSRRGRGGTYDYVTWKDVADRMNEIFGMLWSSEVKSVDATDSNIIIRVSVCAKDPVSKETFCQEGYGGAVIRNGDEPGTGHKSAYSKALKDACKRWGVGLHLEDSTAVETNIPTGFSGHEVAKEVVTPPLLSPVTIPTVPAPTQIPIQTSTVAQPETAITQYAPPVPMPPAPPVSSAPVVIGIKNEAQQVIAPPVPTLPTQNVQVQPAPPQAAPIQAVPAAPTPPVSVSPTLPIPPAPTNYLPKNSEATPDTPGTINNVQEMAIKNLARLSNIEDPEKLLQDLQSNSETGLSRFVKNIADLSYTEAVLVIKAAKNL